MTDSQTAQKTSDEIVAFLKKSGALTAGVASAEDFQEAEESQRPAALLPGAKSVIVMGGAQPRAGDWMSPVHQHMETMGVSDRINSLALKRAASIEKRCCIGADISITLADLLNTPPPSDIKARSYHSQPAFPSPP